MSNKKRKVRGVIASRVAMFLHRAFVIKEMTSCLHMIDSVKVFPYLMLMFYFIHAWKRH